MSLKIGRRIHAHAACDCFRTVLQVPDVRTFDSAVPLRIRAEEHNSLNNRFKPDPECGLCQRSAHLSLRPAPVKRRPSCMRGFSDFHCCKVYSLRHE